MVRTALERPRRPAEGRELEVIDLRTLSPLDLDPVYDSVRPHRRLVVVHEAARSGGLVRGRPHARVTAAVLLLVEAPVARSPGSTPLPGRPGCPEEEYLPDLDRVLDAVDRSMEW
jgi:pyruvate dehydrogenase E1 component beta subunit